MLALVVLGLGAPSAAFSTLAASASPLSSTDAAEELTKMVSELQVQLEELQRAHAELQKENAELKLGQSGRVVQAREECTIEDVLPLEEHVLVPYAEVISNEVTTGKLRTLATNMTKRLGIMDINGASRMVVSLHGPALQALKPEFYHNASAVMRTLNNGVLQLTSTDSNRLKALCGIFMHNVSAAVEELEYCKQAGMVGVLLNGPERTIDADGAVRFDYYYKVETLPFWKACERLGMFVYIHPRHPESVAESSFPTEGLFDSTIRIGEGNIKIAAYDEHDPLGCGDALEKGASFGYALQIAQVALNLIAHGLFDEVPGLQVVIGHGGEFLPAGLWRIDKKVNAPIYSGCQSLDYGKVTNASYPYKGRQHTFSYYLQTNFHVTTSGYLDTAGLMQMIDAVGYERVLFSVDSPFERFGDATDWIRSIQKDHPEISCDVLRGIAYKNAEKLLQQVELSSV